MVWYPSPDSRQQLLPLVHGSNLGSFFVASLSRNLVEAYLTLQYMLEPLSTNGEAILRENVWRYHETFERLKMLRIALPNRLEFRGWKQNLH